MNKKYIVVNSNRKRKQRRLLLFCFFFLVKILSSHYRKQEHILQLIEINFSFSFSQSTLVLSESILLLSNNKCISHISKLQVIKDDTGL